MPRHPPLWRRIRLSVFPGRSGRGSRPETSRRYFNTLVLHFRPREVAPETLRFQLSWGLGGMALVLVLLLMSTGLLLKFVYAPSPEHAYESILFLQSEVPFGRLIRNLHHWGANVLLVVLFLHLLRVFFTGAFHPPRRFNWLVGLGLLLTALLSNFSGYLLPWDQLSFWAVTISTGMLEYVPLAGGWLQSTVRGGAELGPATLSNFYALHTAVLPALFVMILPLHFWRVRKAGGLVVPDPARNEEGGVRVKKVPSIPHLLVREMTVASVLLATMLLLSMLLDAPLSGKANPGLSPNPSKAPWYFGGFQELLMHFHPFFSVFVIPLLGGLGLITIPYLTSGAGASGTWFLSEKGRRTSLLAVFVAIAATPTWIILDEYAALPKGWLGSWPDVIRNGLMPFVLLVGGCALFYGLTVRWFCAEKREAIQAVFTLLTVAFLILMLVCVWFRGEGMRLAWPWILAP